MSLLSPDLIDPEKFAKLPLYLQRCIELIHAADFPDRKNEDEQEAYARVLYLAEAAGQVKEDIDDGYLTAAHIDPIPRARFTKARHDSDMDMFLNTTDPINPYEDLQAYSSKAVLPPMHWSSSVTGAVRKTVITDTTTAMHPAQGSTTAISQSITYNIPPKAAGGSTNAKLPDQIRCLHNIQQLDMAALRQSVKNFVRNLPTGLQERPTPLLPNTRPLYDRDDKTPKDRLTLPAWGFDRDWETGEAAQDETTVAAWVLRFPFKTATRILHIIDRDTRAWSYEKPGGEKSQNMLSDLAWQCGPSRIQKAAEDTGDNEVRMSLVVEIKHPGVFSLEDMKKFTKLPNLPTLKDVKLRNELKYKEAVARAALEGQDTPTQTNPGYTKVENIWAQIYDYCVVQGNFFFICTTYEHWLFGLFSADYTGAQISEPIPYDAQDPTILQYILYWTQSAGIRPGFWEIPGNPMFSESLTAPEDLLVDNVVHYNARLLYNKLRKKTPDKWKDPKKENYIVTAARYAFNLSIPLVQTADDFKELLTSGLCTCLSNRLRPHQLSPKTKEIALFLIEGEDQNLDKEEETQRRLLEAYDAGQLTVEETIEKGFEISMTLENGLTKDRASDPAVECLGLNVGSVNISIVAALGNSSNLNSTVSLDGPSDVIPSSSHGCDLLPFDGGSPPEPSAGLTASGSGFTEPPGLSPASGGSAFTLALPALTPSYTSLSSLPNPPTPRSPSIMELVSMETPPTTRTLASPVRLTKLQKRRVDNSRIRPMAATKRIKVECEIKVKKMQEYLKNMLKREKRASTPNAAAMPTVELNGTHSDGVSSSTRPSRQNFARSHSSSIARGSTAKIPSSDPDGGGKKKPRTDTNTPKSALGRSRRD